jgi:hypothetical protein
MSQRRRDRDALRQWAQLELQIPGLSELLTGKSMEVALYPPPKPPQTSEASMTFRGMNVTEKKA